MFICLIFLVQRTHYDFEAFELASLRGFMCRLHLLSTLSLINTSVHRCSFVRSSQMLRCFDALLLSLLVTLSYEFLLVLCTVISSTTRSAARSSVFDVYSYAAFHRCLDSNHYRCTDRICSFVTCRINNEFLRLSFDMSQLRCLLLRLKPAAPFGKERVWQVPSPTTI